MVVNEKSEIPPSKGESQDSNVRKGSKLRLMKKKRKRSVLLDTKHEVVDDRGNKEKHNDSKRLIPIPSFTPLEEADENVDNTMIVPTMTLKEQDVSNVEKKEPTAKPTNTTATFSVELSSTSFHSSEFKKESRTKRLANQEKERNLLHDDLLHQSKHVLSSKIPSVSSTTHHHKSRSKTTSKSYKLCTLCSTCSCSQGSALTSLEQNALDEQSKSKYMPLGLARTDAEIERALIGRLARLEKSASWFDSLCTKVSKELKRHRRNIMGRRRNTIHKDHMDKTNVFLQDADDIDHDMDTIMGAPSLSKNLVGRAMNKAFTFRKKHQPTLTQMLDGDDSSNKEEEDDTNDDVDNDDYDRHAENETIHHTSLMDVECQDLKNASIMKKNDNKVIPKELLKDDSMHHDQVEDVLVEEETENGDDLHWNLASYRGKAKNLWTASKLSKEKFLPYHLYDVDIPDMNEFDTKISICDDNHNEDGLLELLNAFETASSHCDDGNCNKSEKEGNGFFHVANDMLQRNRSSSLQNQQVNMSQLSPLAKSIHKTLVSNIESDPLKLSVLEEVFPSWKENQRFVLCQSSEDLKFALQNVQSQRTRIEKTIELLTKRNTALQLFEDTINRAIERHGNYDSQSILERDTFPS